MRALTAVFAVLATAALVAGCASGSANGPAPTGETTGHPTSPAQAGGARPEWHAYHNGPGRAGVSVPMPHPTRVRLATSIKLDAAVYASPIVAHGVTIVATENNSVYAFNSRFHRLWRRHLGSPSPASERPCGNIDPLGITGTPLYSPATGLVYVAAEFSGNPPRHQLIALRARTGRVVWRRSLDLHGVDAAAMQQRGALNIAGGRVWVTFGGLAGDCARYRGRIIGYAANGRGRPVAFTVPTAREAGIWTPPGPTSDGHGHLFVAVGNGAAGPGDRYDLSDSVLELSTRAQLVDWFAPRSWAADNASDRDLGSQGPALVGPWVFIDGKGGIGYVLRRNHLGHLGGQVHSARICTSFGGTAVVNNIVYVPCTDGVRAVRIDTNGRPHVVWHAAAAVTGSPVVGGRRVWSLDPSGGRLYALNPRTGHVAESVHVGATTRFATPAIDGTDILVPTESGLAVVATR